jgi:hypothetical protein
MKLDISNKMLTLAVIGLVAVIVLALVINRYMSRSKFQWPAASPQDNNDTSLQTDLQSYQDAYNIAMINFKAMPEGADKTTAMMNAEQTLATSINTRVNAYVTSKCGAASGTAPPSTDAAATTAWNTYQANLGKIQGAYLVINNNASAATNPTSEQVIAARKADISGATRKYLATRCPNFYKTESTDPTATYTAWTLVESGASAPAAGNGFFKPNVTTGNIATWAGYAARTKSTSANLTVQPGTGVVASIGSVTVPDTTGFNVSDPVQFTYQTVNKDTGVTTTSGPITGTITAVTPTTMTINAAIPASGFIVPSGTVIAKALISTSTTWNKVDGSNVPNWKKARDYGPGSYPAQTWGTNTLA